MGKKSLAALLCATMAMTACMLPATAAMADEPLKIEFFQQKGEEGPQKGYKEIIDKFNKENSDIEIEMNTVPDAGTVLTSRISSGDIPVIFSDFPTQTQFKQKVANGYVQDLSDQDFLKNVNESALEMTKQEDGGYYRKDRSRGRRLFIDPWYSVCFLDLPTYKRGRRTRSERCCACKPRRSQRLPLGSVIYRYLHSSAYGICCTPWS